MTKKFPGQRIFTKTEAAIYLGVSEKTLREMTANREIPTYDFHGRRAYRREDLDRYIEHLQPWTDGPKGG